jgi:hypothetical protein
VDGTAYTNVGGCGATPCTFTCNATYTWNGSVCAACSPVNCAGYWGGCSNCCGAGTQSFVVTTAPSCGGAACPVSPQNCNGNSCCCVGECCGQPDGTLCNKVCDGSCIGFPHTCNGTKDQEQYYWKAGGKCSGESCVACGSGVTCAQGATECDFSAAGKCQLVDYCAWQIFSSCGGLCGGGIGCTAPMECDLNTCTCECLAQGQGCGLFTTPNGHYNCCSGLTCSNGATGICESCTGWQFQHCGSPCPNAGDCWGTYHCATNTCSVSGTTYDCAADAGCFASNCNPTPHASCNMVNDECCSHNCVHTGGATEPQAWDGHCGGL